MSDNPPPYPGIVPNAGPSKFTTRQQEKVNTFMKSGKSMYDKLFILIAPNGYPGQQPSYGGYQQPQQPYGGYPPAYPSQPQSNVYPQVPSSNPGYPPANNGYAPPYGGNVAQGGMQQSSYPYSPPSTAYPPASNPGYPSANPGYPPANPGYPNPSAGGAGGWAAPPSKINWTIFRTLFVYITRHFCKTVLQFWNTFNSTFYLHIQISDKFTSVHMHYMFEAMPLTWMSFAFQLLFFMYIKKENYKFVFLLTLWSPVEIN